MPSSGWFALLTQTALPRYRHKIPNPSNFGSPHPVRAEGRPNQKQEQEGRDRDFPQATSISMVLLVTFDRLVREHSVVENGRAMVFQYAQKLFEYSGTKDTDSRILNRPNCGSAPYSPTVRERCASSG